MNRNITSTDWIEEKKLMIIRSICRDECENIEEAIAELGWPDTVITVLCVEQYDKHYKNEQRLSELIMYSGASKNELVAFRDDDSEIVIMRGKNAMDRLENLISHVQEHQLQVGSQLSRYFITCGMRVKRVADLNKSYKTAKMMMELRFYCDENVRMWMYDESVMVRGHISMDAAKMDATRICDAMQAHNRIMMTDEVDNLAKRLIKGNIRPEYARAYLLNMYVQLKHRLQMRYGLMLEDDLSYTRTCDSMLQSNSLYEIIGILNAELLKDMNRIGGDQGETVMNDLYYYVAHNYHSELRLENLAPLFGYNSAYLGKLFKEKNKESFHTYVDRVRMDKACELLKNTELKVYEVAEQVGYHNVDYFHIKFQKYIGKSPVEYRKEQGKTDVRKT